MYREAAFAWAKGLPAPACVDYDPRWFRGLEGVVDHSPRPSVA